MKSLLLTVMAVLTASFVFAEAVNVTAYQRWPWNGKVDITFTIPEPDTDETRIYSVEYFVSIDGGEPIALNAIEGDGANNEAVLTPGFVRSAIASSASIISFGRRTDTTEDSPRYFLVDITSFLSDISSLPLVKIF